ncbi:MAG: SUMF1/EgtB/PvdO family nonheme iron enzyme, partial [Planctomycetes bacterium]|nr:SUMF1/EgtB/PvdO family nonheme iron enzyme [Planctomycetota bacterium]
QPGTTPVGYYDGTDHGGIFQTRSNSNLYAICALSGNVREWVSDTQDSGDTLQRGLRSGHYSVNTSSLQCAYRVSSSPATTDESCGFRVVTATP